jgi:hypothetical protein
MKTLPLIPAVIVAVALSAPGVFAEDVTPVSPAPAAVDHVVYLAKLPTPAELIKGAERQRSTIERIDQTSAQITVTYRYSSGRQVTFSYALLSAVAADVPVLKPAPAESLENGTVAPPPPPPTTVVYASPPPPAVYYKRPVRYYDPAWDWVAPLAVGVSLGWVWHGGHDHHYPGWHGGHRGYWHGRHHGGWRRH